MRTILIALAALWSAPALADSCIYVADNGDRLQFSTQFIDDDHNVRVWSAGEGESRCLWMRHGDRDGLSVVCEDFEGDADFTGPDGNNVMVLDKRTWKCDGA